MVAAAGAGGFLLYRVTAERPRSVTMQPANAPQLAGDTHSALPDAPPGRTRTIPERLPEFQLADRDGTLRSLADWRGRPLIVNFWATWCAPCRREIPLLMELRRQRTAQDLEIIGIAVDFREAVLAYAQDIGIDYPLLIGEEGGLQAVDAFGMDAVFPFTVFADREGRVVALKVGELHAPEADYILDRVADVDAGRLPLQSARQQIARRLRELAAERAGEAGHPVHDPG